MTMGIRFRQFLVSEKHIISIFLVALLLRMLFLSPWLEDWDSVQFALALHDYSVVAHQPHPPGYPLYILLTKLLNIFLQNDTLALTFLSALLGSLALFPLYILAKQMFGKTVALGASLLYTFSPVGWVVSETGISNTPGLFFLILLAPFAFNSDGKAKSSFLLGGAMGLVLGVRFTDLPVVAGFILFSVIKHRKVTPTLYLILGILVGVAVWLVPLLQITGFKNFWEAYRSTSSYILWHDVLLGKNLTITSWLFTRISLVMAMLEIAYTKIFIFLALIISIWSFYKKRFFTQSRYQFLGIWLLSYSIPLVFFYNLELSQYALPLLPPLVILLAASLLKSNLSPKIFSRLLLFAILLNFIRVGLPQVVYQAKIVPPTIKPVLYVKENFDPSSTTLITSYVFRQFQYYAPEFTNFYGAENVPSGLQSKLVITDYEGFIKEIPELSNYAMIDKKDFGKSQNSFVRLPETNLYVLRRLD